MSSPKWKYVFTGGGSGGHVAPALAIAESIRQQHPDARFYYVGVKGKAEASMVPRAWKSEIASKLASLHFVRSRGFPGLGAKFPLFAIDLALGVLKSLFLLLMWRPDAIVATGGYVSAPILLACFSLRKVKLVKTKIFLHEQNAVLGRMNALAVRFADKVGVAFAETSVPKSKKAFVGYPVRKAVASKRGGDAQALRLAAREKLKIPVDAKVLFAFGGSQGARTINRGLVDALPYLLADPQVWVVHGTGKQLKGNVYNGMEDVQQRIKTIELPDDWEKRYLPKDFFHDMGSYYAASDVVLCRGGAGSLNEVCANGVPAVAIPKANLPGDHQAFNARSMERMGIMKVIYESVDLNRDDAIESVNPKELAEILQPLLNNPDLCSQMIAAGEGHYNPATTLLCQQVVDSMLDMVPFPLLPEPPEQENERILGLNSNQLLHLLRRTTGEQALTVEEKRLALYKVDGYLASGGYVLPARGCRMIGYGGFEERLTILLAFASKKNGDVYLKLPITRRDAFHGIALLGKSNDEVWGALEKGLEDPYFEARAMALYALTKLVNGIEDVSLISRFLPKLKELSQHRAFDTRINAIRAISELANDYDTISKTFFDRRFDSHWKVRESLLRGLARLVERGVISERKAAIEGDEVLRTSDGYRMIFPIKEAFQDLPGRNTLKG